jgi:hypothetical protein
MSEIGYMEATHIQTCTLEDLTRIHKCARVKNCYQASPEKWQADKPQSRQVGVVEDSG